MRPLVVISIVKQVRKDPKYALTVADIREFERRHGRIPEGLGGDGALRLVEEVDGRPRDAKALAADPNFPGVSLTALQFLHLKRHILFHGHEPLDTDTTPTLEGEYWLMHNGYTQAEGVENLDGCRRPAASSRSATRSSRAASAATRATSRSARPGRRTARDLRRRRAAAEERQPAALGPEPRLPGPLSGM